MSTWWNTLSTTQNRNRPVETNNIVGAIRIDTYGASGANGTKALILRFLGIIAYQPRWFPPEVFTLPQYAILLQLGLLLLLGNVRAAIESNVKRLIWIIHELTSINEGKHMV